MGCCDTLHEDQRRFVVLIIVTVFSKIRIEAEEAVILLTQTIFSREMRAEPEEERSNEHDKLQTQSTDHEKPTVNLLCCDISMHTC